MFLVWSLFLLEVFWEYFSGSISAWLCKLFCASHTDYFCDKYLCFLYFIETEEDEDDEKQVDKGGKWLKVSITFFFLFLYPKVHNFKRTSQKRFLIWTKREFITNFLKSWKAGSTNCRGLWLRLQRKPASCNAGKNAWRSIAARCRNIADIGIETFLVLHIRSSLIEERNRMIFSLIYRSTSLLPEGIDQTHSFFFFFFFF